MQFSDAFEIQRCDEDDWFDPDLSIDTRLFLDPFLLLDERERGESPFAEAHDRLIEHFARCYELLARAGAKAHSANRLRTHCSRFRNLPSSVSATPLLAQPDRAAANDRLA